MAIKITQTITRFIKNPNTKTTYNQVEQETTEITEKQHNNATSSDTMKFFKRLGGLESRRMAYTCNGYICVKSISISPDKQNKIIREYKFIS